MMLSEPNHHQSLVRHQNGAVWDPVSQTTYTLHNDSLLIKQANTQKQSRVFLDDLPPREPTLPTYLKFKNTLNKNLLVNPSGQLLTCKSERLQQCDMNISYSSGVHIWSIYCSGNCLSLTVGVRNQEKKRQYTLQFTAQSPIKISFKLDFEKHIFSSWVTKAIHQMTKNIELPQENLQLTPFIRVKGMRVNLYLNTFVEDPEMKLSNFNIFGNLSELGQAELSTNQIELQKTQPENTKFTTLDILDQDTLIVRGKNRVRILRRLEGQKIFNLDLAQLQPENKICISFSRKQLEILELGHILIKGDLKQVNYISKSLGEWNQWGKTVCAFLDRSRRQGKFLSTEIFNRVYEIILRKFQCFKFSQNLILRPTIASNYDKELVFGVNKCLFSQPTSSFSIPRSISLNNAPSLAFNYEIKGVIATKHYLVAWLSEMDRICIINREDDLFKVADVILKKGIKKQSEMNQFQKNLDELQSSNSSEPSIYKILKNCLKYADKVKPPQKLIKKMEEKKSKETQNRSKEIPKQTEFQPDKSLLNTLISMGFGIGPSKKALTQCKNVSLQEAIDLILKKYINQPEEIEKPSTTTTGTQKWTCQMCTLDNPPSSLTCQACTAPKPMQLKEEIKEQKKQQEKIQEEAPKEEQIVSQNIDMQEAMVKVFAWQLQVAYSPLLIAGVFKDKIRFRLFGPNPRYYSNFYSKNEEFVDLSNFSIHQEAHQIDQRPIRYQYYRSSIPQQQKQFAYGWIPIEDLDLPSNKIVSDVSIHNIKQKKKETTFTLVLKYQDDETKQVQGVLSLPNVFEEKLRALKLNSVEKEEEIEPEISKKTNQRKYTLENSNVLPPNGCLQIDMVNKNSSQIFDIVPEVISCEQVSDKPSRLQNSEYLPLRCVNSDKSIQISFVRYPLYPGKRPIILQHLHNKEFSVSTLVIQKIGKSATFTEHKGHFWFSKDLTKSPCEKYSFVIPKGIKKAYIECPSDRRCVTSYLSVSLEEKESKNDDLSCLQEISFSGVMGETFSNTIQSNPIFKTKFFDNQFRIEVSDLQGKISKDIRYEIGIVNHQIDLELQDQRKVQEILANAIKGGQSLDLRINISNYHNSQLVLQKIELPNWIPIRQNALYILDKRPMIIEADYKELLKSCIQSPCLETLNAILEDQNKEYRFLLSSEGYNLTDFFNRVLSSPLEKPLKSKYSEFIRKFSDHIMQASKAGHFDYKNLLINILHQKTVSILQIELVFQLGRLFPVEQQLLQKELINKLKILSEKRQNGHQLGNRQGQGLMGIKEKAQNLVLHRFLVARGSIYRKYVIDMFNVYEIKTLALNVEKSDRKSPMKILVFSVNEDHTQNKELQIFYNQSVFEQMMVFLQENRRNTSNSNQSLYLPLDLHSKIRCRYLIIEISFAANPTNPSLKEIEKMPQSEIIPQITGNYIGESDLMIDEFNLKMSALRFVQNYGEINKYSIEEPGFSKVYYYMADNIKTEELILEEGNVDAKDKEQIREFKSLNRMIESALAELSQRGTHQVISNDLMGALLDNISNHQRNYLQERIVNYLKKLCKKNVQICQFMMKQRIPTQSLFHQLFRESQIQVKVISEELSKGSENIFLNSVWFCKCKHSHPEIRNLVSLIYELSLQNNKIDATISLMQKFGWVNQQVMHRILQEQINKNRGKVFINILRSCRDNVQLAKYVATIISDQASYQYFLFGIQELGKSERKVKEEEIHIVITEFMNFISKKCECLNSSFDEEELNQEFVTLSGIMNQFKVNNEGIVNQYVDTFAKIMNKLPLIKKFLEVEALKADKYSEKILEIGLRILQEIISLKSRPSQKQENLSLVNEILIFLFRNQYDFIAEEDGNAFLNKLTQSNQSKLLKVFSQMMVEQLNVGGESNIKIANSLTVLNLSISSCLATIIRKNLASINEKPLQDDVFRKLIRWLFFNAKTVHHKPVVSNWDKIQDLVWQAVCKSPNINLKILTQEFDCLNDQLSKFQNYESESNSQDRKNMIISMYSKMYLKRLYYCTNKILTNIANQQVREEIIKSMAFQRIFTKIIEIRKQCLDEEDTNLQNSSSRVTEQQLANSFKLQNSLQKQPQDWLIYKNGAKNSVYEFEYPKSAKKTYELLFEFEPHQAVIISKILIAFQYKTNNNETSCIPNEINVQGGNSLEQLKYLGKMIALPDDHFINYSVRVFGLNINQTNANKFVKSFNKIHQCRYIRLSISHNNKESLQTVLSLTSEKKQEKIMKSSINFLSILGYLSENSIPNFELQSLVDFIKIISQVKSKQTVSGLFKQEKIVKIFNEALPNMSLLMRNQIFERVIHKFIMRVCQVNTQIGDQTINKYLTLKNSYLCAKIVAEIILGNCKYIAQRLIKMNQFIISNLSDLLEKSEIGKVEPYLDRFCQIINIIMNQSSILSQIGKVPLKFEQSAFKLLIGYKNKSEIVARYINCILSMGDDAFDVDFGVNKESLYDFINENIDVSLNKQILQALIIGNKSVRSWFMQKNELENIYNHLIALIMDTNIENSSQIVDKLNFLSELCLNSNIKSLVNKNQYNIEIFKKIFEEEKMLTYENNGQLRTAFVNFIIRSVLNSQNERVIGEQLKQSLMGNIGESNQNFVGQVFLPILNSFNKIPISIIPYDKTENKLIVDQNSLIINPKGTTKKTAKETPQKKFRLPSNILNQQHKQQLAQELKNTAKIMNGHFNLAFNHGSNPVDSNFDSILSRKQSFLLVFKLSEPTNPNTRHIVGVYYNQDGSIAKENVRYWNDRCLLFLTTDKQNSLEFINVGGQVGKKMLQFSQTAGYDMFDDPECSILELNYNQMPFGEVNYESDYQYSIESFFSLTILNKSKPNNLQLQSAEYWILESQSQNDNHSIEQSQQSLTSLLMQRSGLESFSFVSKQFQSSSPARFLKPYNIYEFPSSITIIQLKEALQIFKCRLKNDKFSELQFYALSNSGDIEPVSNQTSLLNLHKKRADEPILDLFIEVDSLGDFLDFTSSMSKKPLEYLPKKGILKYFEENDGITSMIKVLKKSISTWKNNGLREKWHQYASELERFSSFPHFFGQYLKDSQSFELLFKLLSGLPDTEENDKKWLEMEAKSSQKLLKIVSSILSMDKTSQFREFAMKNQFFETILERLRLLTGLFKRSFKQKVEEEIEQQSPSKAIKEDDGTKQIKKKKGVGYGNDGSSNTKWMKGVTEAELQKEFQVIQIILNMIENFLDFRNWTIPKQLLQNIYESALLPYLQDSLRAGTLLEISKHPAKFRLVFKILSTLSRNQQLVPILMPIPKNYQPRQIQSIASLLKSLENTAVIFLSCLKQNQQNSKKDKVSEELANLIVESSKAVEQAIDNYNDNNEDQSQLEEQMKNILELTTDKQYRTLMKDLRFDYIDMKQGNRIKHHYSSSFSQNYTPNQNKMIRLAQQLADISTALPFEHTNAIYVRCDKDRVDFMQALIMGSNGTPYGHGAFLFDVYFEDSYPNVPPKVNLTTTGHGKVRFNPNLYACGKVCLSLLGTWRGSASENWDPKVSTLLQVLLSIQAIIMSEEVYFNEPGFEHEQGTTQGQKKNEAYSNIVRHANIKFAMLQNIRNPPKGFETVIRRHFYIKREEIMAECKKWLLYAEKRPANYIGLVNDHNNSWSTEFKKSKTQYKQTIEKLIGELEEEFKKLQPPSIHDIISRSAQKKKQKKAKKKVDLLKKLEEQEGQEIDVAYESKNNEGQSKQIDINDEKVKDRWSRYIGAMGVDAVSKQSKADIIIFGLGPMSLEVVKNIVMSGCRKLTICDDANVAAQDLSGGFFYNESDVGKSRIGACIHKIRELNAYVKIDAVPKQKATLQFIKNYSIVFISEMPLPEQFQINQFCRSNKIKFISGECKGAYCRLLNDMGQGFEVLDKNGEEPVEVIIKDITSEETATVTLLDGSKHPYQDNEAVLIKNVQGMQNKEDSSKSINGTIHKIKVINSKSFTIGDTRGYNAYIRNGTVKNIKTPLILDYKSMEDVYKQADLPIDENLQFYDFVKMNKNKIIHNCFVALDIFTQKKKAAPKPWDIENANEFLEIYTQLSKQDIDEATKKYVKRFSYTCSGVLPPLSAYFGGFVSQQIIKAITQKYKPAHSVFYMDAQEVIPELPEQEAKISDAIKNIYSNENQRLKGLQIVVGKDLVTLIKNSKLFMIGAGAIGCELLKNFAMIGLGSGDKGKITLTDPDHIQNSNLNRQFLFRQKHISKPKSKTAAASVMMMNPELKGHVSALLERVSDSTKDIFSNSFFESLTIVANALDNVAARRYVDQRCVENKVPLFESGTLGPKGHTQVILPFKTQSYGSQNDPVEQGEIPHCTLKMFPEETLHCVEWARDIFGKKFSLQPKAFLKIKDKSFKPEKQDIKSLNESLVMANKGPRNFDDCISYAAIKFYKYFRDDIIQLLYTYPLDAKTKNGEPFWKLPKRPPTPINKLDEGNLLHCTFISSMAVLIAKIYKIPYPKNFREQKQRRNITKEATKIKIPDYVPSDEKSKEIMKESENEKEKKEEEEIEEIEQAMEVNEKDQMQLFEEFLKSSEETEVLAEEFEKDDDQNGHIDFIYSMANLRAENYKLDEMDWITTKLKAGRIVPALSTTTTCVAGLQTLQICKYLKNLKLESMRNAFLNLAVPSLQMSEPGQVQKMKITENLTVTLWDRWEVPCNEKTTFKEVYEYLRKKYGLIPIGVQQGMRKIDTNHSETGMKEFLNSKVVDKLDKDEDAYIDIIVLFAKSEKQQKMLTNIPPVRLTFSA